jgi:hypothetical protein
MQQVITTCDHCGAELRNYIGSLWRASLLTIGANMDDVHGCSKEHLGFALAKAFGIPIDTNTLTLVTQKNEALEAARDIAIKRDEACAEVDRLSRRIAELEKRLVPPTVDGKTPGVVAREAWHGEDEPDDDAGILVDWENAAQAVLRAFGQNAAEALGRVRERLVGMGVTPAEESLRADFLSVIDSALITVYGVCPKCKGRGEMPVDAPDGMKGLISDCDTCKGMGRIIDDELAKLGGTTKPFTDHVHEVGSCTHCDTRGITDTKPPTKPLVGELVNTLGQRSNEEQVP